MKKETFRHVFKLVILILLTALAVVFAYKFRNVFMPEETTVPTDTSPLTQTETEPASVITSENKTEKESESENGKDKKKTILNADVGGAYEPTAFEAKLFNAVNSKRKEAGVSGLNWNGCLHTLAKARADETLSLFSHTRPDGRKPSTVLTDNKIEFSLFGECLAKGAKEDDEGVSLLIDGLVKESEQSETVLGSEYSYAAVAVSTDDDGYVYAVILLCNP